MKTYEFSVNLIVEVDASNEEEAYEKYAEMVIAPDNTRIINEDVYSIEEVQNVSDNNNNCIGYVHRLA